MPNIQSKDKNQIVSGSYGSVSDAAKEKKGEDSGAVASIMQPAFYTRYKVCITQGKSHVKL